MDERTDGRSRVIFVLLLIAFSLILLALLLPSVAALRNPAAVYCDSMGYNYTVESLPDGDFLSSCALPDGTKADAWRFLEGTEGTNYSYCAKEGYPLEVVNGSACGRLFTTECAACVVNGTPVEVTSLMGLTFAETTCGDGRCGFPENAASCPRDCPPDARDMRCETARDGICDPDCDGATRATSDPDCPGAGSWLLVLLGALLLAVVLAGAFVLRGKRRKSPSKKRKLS